MLRIVYLLVRLALLLMPGFACAASSRAPVASPDHFVLFVGQSNIAGRTPFQGEDFIPVESMRQFDDQGNWVTVRNLDHNINAEHGRDDGLNRFSSIRKRQQDQLLSPAYAFARSIAPNGALGILVEGRSGISITQLAPDAAPPADSDFTRNLFEMVVARVLAAKATGAQLDAVIWLQGESDAIHFGEDRPGYVRDMDHYLQTLERFIASFRARVGDRDLPFIISEILPVTRYPLDATENYRATSMFDRQIPEIARRARHVTIVSAIGTNSLYAADSAKESCPSDCLHFDHASNVTMGARYADAFLAVLPRSGIHAPRSSRYTQPRSRR